MRTELRGYLEAAFPAHTCTPLTGDASTRRFWRLTPSGGETRVVMDYGASFVGETDDVRLNRVFVDARLPVAEIEAVAPAAGCLVLEDLGDTTLESALVNADPETRSSVYRRAIELLHRIATDGSAALERLQDDAGPVLDAERFRFEMDFFLEHYVSGLMKERADDELRERLQDLAQAAAGGEELVLCHRDYHSRNLMVRPGGDLAMVDIQDARWGPDVYDLASLLRDAYVDLGAGEVDVAMKLFRRGLSGAAAETLEDRFHTAAAQRMIKALGTFGYQIAVAGNERYRDSIPRTLSRLARSLSARPSTLGLARSLAGHRLLTLP